MSRPSGEAEAPPTPPLPRGERNPAAGLGRREPAPSPPGGGRARPVRRRHVFYLSGFDPKGPAHYHRLYTDEAAKAAALNGYTVQVGPRRKVTAQVAAWSVHFDDGRSAPVDTEVEFLRWDDIVRDHWPKHPAVLAWDLLRTTWLYLRTGALWRMYTLAWPPVVALVVPVLILLALLALLPAALALGVALAARTGSAWVGGLAGVALVAGAWALARLAERHFNMQWLLRSHAFTGRQGTAGLPALEARLDRFAEHICERVRQAAGGDPAAPRCDEVLVVAHSSGSIMAVAALARALAREPALTQLGPRVALLTLGQCLPLLSSLPSASGFRAELDRLARDPALDWVDFTAPPDGCCFALTDPIRAAGLPPAPRPDHPRLLSPRFAAAFSAARYAEIKRDRFRLHFQYLMAGELPGGYDYTQVTAGPIRLGDRHAALPSVTGFTQFQSRWGRGRG